MLTFLRDHTDAQRLVAEQLMDLATRLTDGAMTLERARLDALYAAAEAQELAERIGDTAGAIERDAMNALAQHEAEEHT